MSKEARHLMLSLGLAVVLVLGVLFFTPGSVYNPLTWIIKPLTTAANPIYHNIQAHQVGWFRWTLLVLVALAVRVAGKILFMLERLHRHNRWSNMSKPSGLNMASVSFRRSSLDPKYAGLNRRPRATWGFDNSQSQGVSLAKNQGRTDLSDN